MYQITGGPGNFTWRSWAFPSSGKTFGRTGEIFAIPGAPERPSYPEARGLRHLAFRVDDVEEAVRELEARGIPCEPIRWDPFSQKRMTFFHDPDGLPLELHE